VQPDGVSDDLGRKAVAAIRRLIGMRGGAQPQPRLIADTHSS
jgi:hypothetical protein